MKNVTTAEIRPGKRCRVSGCFCRCSKSYLLICLTFMTGHFLFLYNDWIPSRQPWIILINRTLLAEQEKHGFLDTEEEEAGHDPIHVHSAVQGGGGGGGNVENVITYKDKGPCPDEPLGLMGPLKVNKNPPSLEEQERNHSEQLALGGHYEPENCTARHKVAIIIPYRDRRSHLTVLVNHLHPILRRQQLEYNIFVVEQAGSDSFNRGMLMNVGFKEALNKYPFECIILHDVDLVPEDDRNLYTCSQPPRHMSTSISSHNYRLIYEGYFGGVSAMTASQFKAINGFSNKFWGWGGEDDDLFNRVRHQGLSISRHPGDVGRYTMLSHKKAKPNPSRVQELQTGKQRFKTDGLSSLKYQILETERRHLFTWMLVALPRY